MPATAIATASAPSQNGLPTEHTSPSAQDSIWGIPTPVFSAGLGSLIGAAAGAAATAVFFYRARRHTLTDRAEDQQRQDAQEAQRRADREEEQRRIDARGSWKRLYDELGKDLSDALAVYIDARDHLLYQGDAEAQLISTLLKRLLHARERARGNRSEDLIESITVLYGRLRDLQEALLPERTSLTDPSSLNHTQLLDLFDRAAKQTLITAELGPLVHNAEVVLNTEWGRPATL